VNRSYAQEIKEMKDHKGKVREHCFHAAPWAAVTANARAANRAPPQLRSTDPLSCTRGDRRRLYRVL
jgi:hypothetical protein